MVRKESAGIQFEPCYRSSGTLSAHRISEDIPPQKIRTPLISNNHVKPSWSINLSSTILARLKAILWDFRSIRLPCCKGRETISNRNRPEPKNRLDLMRHKDVHSIQRLLAVSNRVPQVHRPRREFVRYNGLTIFYSDIIGSHDGNTIWTFEGY